VYGLVDPNTKQIRYVGITYRLKRRFQDHLQTAKKCRNHKEKWINSLLMNSGNKLTNSTDGGEGCPNPSPETIQKIKHKLTGRRCSGPLTAKGRQKLIDNSTGRIFSKERCDNISKAKRGKKFSLEHKKKLSEARIKLFQIRKQDPRFQLIGLLKKIIRKKYIRPSRRKPLPNIS
jgi:hypothetical protein